MTDTTPDYRLKTERAKVHLAEFVRAFEAFRAGHPYDHFVERDESAKQFVWKLKINTPIPRVWSTIVGDAIHNVRTALDILFCAIACKADPARSVRHVHFVVRETQEQFEADLPRNTIGMPPEAIRLVHDLKPYKGGNDVLWRLHQLDIRDKHRAIVPVGSAYRSFDIGPFGIAMLEQVLAENGTPRKLPQPPPALLMVKDRQFPLQDGADLFRMPMDQPLPADNDLRFEFDVSLAEDGIVADEPVVPLLTTFIEMVERIFDTFEAHSLV